MAVALSVAIATLVAAQLGLLIFGRWALALVASWLASGGCVVAGIVQHVPLLFGIGAFNLALALAWWWWQGPRGRRRAKRQLGDESRQVRDGLVRRMRQRVTARRGLSPSPSRWSPAWGWSLRHPQGPPSTTATRSPRRSSTTCPGRGWQRPRGSSRARLSIAQESARCT
jgi:hypothetical protein